MTVRPVRILHAARTFAWRRAFAVVTLVAVGFVADVRPAFSRDSLLLIGNSFTAGLRPRLRALVRSAGRDVVVSARAIDGWTLAIHAASGSTLSKIESAPWNAVVLQEQSYGISEERYPAARSLDAEITGRTIFFMTWRNRDEELGSYDELRGEPGAAVGYVPIAFELDASVAPIGWAFREILLNESDPDLWSKDGHHASERGKYLACLVLYATIYGESPVGLWWPSSLQLNQALADQLLVETLVLGNPAQWNIDADPLASAPIVD